MVKLAAMHLIAESALRGYLGPKLASDAKLDLKPIVSGLTGAGYVAAKAKLAADIKTAVVGKLAKDADIDDVTQMLDALEDVAEEVAEEIESKDIAEDEDEDDKKKPDEDDDAFTARMKKKADDKKAKDAATETDAEKVAREKAENEKKAKDVVVDKDKDKGMVTKAAMDEAIAKAGKIAEDAAIKRMTAIADAERLIAPYIGEIKGVKPTTAAGILKLALDANKIDLQGVPEAAYGAMLKLVPKPAAEHTGYATPRLPGVPPPAMAQDSKGGYLARFPAAAHLKRRGV